MFGDGSNPGGCPGTPPGCCWNSDAGGFGGG